MVATTSNCSDGARSDGGEKRREFPFTRSDFDFLRRVANEQTGIVVGDDKFDMFYARLSRRVRGLGLNSFKAYCELLKSEKGRPEILELVNAITTNLTAFFRENHHFEYMAKTVIPYLLERNARQRKVRIWSSGCSSGEEPYSLAIALKESPLGRNGWNSCILATDIDSNMLAQASRGVYPVERIQGISPSRLRRWVLRGKGNRQGWVRMKPELRAMIDFAKLNLSENWFVEEPMDVIFCRNVIIYFDRETKIKLIDRYADNLKSGGYFFIGHSESLFKLTDRFELIGHTIYRKKK